MKIIFPVLGAENISVCYLSTALKSKGHSVKVAFDRSLFDDKQYFTVLFLNRIFNEKQAVIKAIIKEKPDILALSVFADNYQWSLDVTRSVRKFYPCITVWGGIHPTSCPEEVIRQPEVDYMIVGEGEEPFLDLLEALENKTSTGRIPNVWTRTGDVITRNSPRRLMEPKDFPKVDKTIYEKFIPMREYYLTVTSKGCIVRCSYCMQNFLHRWEKENALGSFLREKSVDAVLEELVAAKQTYGIQYIDIKNNVLTGNKEWLREFTDRYPREVGLPFRVMGHPLLFQDDSAKRLKDAGCHHIQLGIESFNPEVRKNILLRTETNAQIITAMDSIEKVGINFSADIMVGLPGETEEDLIYALRTLSGYRRLIRASIFWLQYLPNVDITRMASEKRYIDENDQKAITQGLQNNYLSTGSAMESDRMRILKTYHIMFRLLPAVSERVINFLIDSKLYKILGFLPFQTAFIIAIDVLVSYIRRDYYALWIIKWYMRQIGKHISGKIEYI